MTRHLLSRKTVEARSRRALVRTASVACLAMLTVAVSAPSHAGRVTDHDNNSEYETIVWEDKSYTNTTDVKYEITTVDYKERINGQCLATVQINVKVSDGTYAERRLTRQAINAALDGQRILGPKSATTSPVVTGDWPRYTVERLASPAQSGVGDCSDWINGSDTSARAAMMRQNDPVQNYYKAYAIMWSIFLISATTIGAAAADRYKDNPKKAIRAALMIGCATGGVAIGLKNVFQGNDPTRAVQETLYACGLEAGAAAINAASAVFNVGRAINQAIDYARLCIFGVPYQTLEDARSVGDEAEIYLDDMARR